MDFKLFSKDIYSHDAAFIVIDQLYKCNGTGLVTVKMSQWNTQQISSAEFCRVLPVWLACGNLWQTKANYGKAMARSSKFGQCLPDSTEVCQEDCVYIYIYAHITTKNPDYLDMRFSHYSFFSLYNVLFFIRAIPLNLNRIYIIPLDLL
jgi:hypothetical protein